MNPIPPFQPDATPLQSGATPAFRPALSTAQSPGKNQPDGSPELGDSVEHTPQVVTDDVGGGFGENETDSIGGRAVEGPVNPVAALGDWRVTEANRRKEILATFHGLLAQNISRTQAARKIGVGYATIWRYENAVKAGGDDALMPKTEDCGRKSKFVAVLKDQAFCKKLMDLYLATIGASGGNVCKGRRTAKMATALTAMAAEPECPEPLAAHLQRGHFPICLQRFLRRITPEMENRVRGPKHYQLNGLVSRRDLTVRFPDGQRGDLPAGFKWVFDDMSVNQPFWCQADGKILFSRQGLYCIDQRSIRWLGKMLVARPREAYRSEDILRFLRGLFLAYGGKPDVIVFERGVWMSLKIKGFKLNEFGQPVEEEFVRGEMAEAEKHLLTDGLKAIGITVIYATSARGKIIEGCFNPLQTEIAMKTRDFNNIGRHAGEFELPGKRLAQVRAGSRTPLFAGFAPAEILDERIDQAMLAINARKNSRGEIPDEVWAADIARRPLAENHAEDAAVFLPDVRERTIDGGRVTVQVDGTFYDFRAPWMIELGGSYRVFCRFDRSEPTRGAAIYNRETGPANFNGYKPGQFLGFAPWETPAPSADVPAGTRGITPMSVAEFYGEGAMDNGDDIRKKQGKLVATFFSALSGKTGLPGQPHVVRTREMRDGEGRVARVESAPATGEMPAAAATTATATAAPATMRPLALPARPNPDTQRAIRRRMTIEVDDALANLTD